MSKLNITFIFLLAVILAISVYLVISINNLNSKIDQNQNRILNNQDAIYQEIKK